MSQCIILSTFMHYFEYFYAQLRCTIVQLFLMIDVTQNP